MIRAKANRTGKCMQAVQGPANGGVLTLVRDAIAGRRLHDEAEVVRQTP
jgi:hypothetical protein